MSSDAMSPAVGMLATVRNRRGIISAVEPFDGHEGRLHLVTIEYADSDGALEDQLIWEREPGATLVPPAALPVVAHHAPMDAQDFDALNRATRWGAIQPFLDPDGPDGPLQAFPISAPLHGAIQLEDFQLVPLLKALRMPRVTLLLADDVGLGKTVEAGLILSELLLRRRVRRILILCPASLRRQWRREMHDKFSLSFDEIDRDSTHQLRKELGMDANPWRTFPRVIASYHYLRQADVLEDFRAASRPPEGSPRLPWDLLVVDEAHNLAPATFGEDSDLAQMLSHLAPLFEHRLFLSATPHDGQTRRFTGLLEQLDPVRFHKGPLEGAMKARVADVLVRRLKREINAVTSPPRFCARTAQAVPVVLGGGEMALAAAVEAFRAKVKQLVSGVNRADEQAGSFAVEVLRKRLLSGPVAFADSWHRYREGTRDDAIAEANEVRAAERAVREDTDDDLEADGRAAHAARTVGAWLKPLVEHLTAEVDAIERALDQLGLADPSTSVAERRPGEDCRFDGLVRLIEERLFDGDRLRDDERLIVFTEYKTSLDYLHARLEQRLGGDGRVRVLFGGPGFTEREAIIGAFNDPDDPVRVLVATDAAAEGLNLQETARYVLHWDVPWNPSRLEQRNGRLDRHGQARDVTAFHFTSDDDQDLSFVARLVEKIDTIRDDLGSFGEVFDVAFQSRFIAGRSSSAVEQALHQGLLGMAGRAEVERDATVTTVELAGHEVDESRRIAALCAELDLSPQTLRDTLETALAIGVGRPRLDPPDEHGRVRLQADRIPPGWTALVDDTLRVGGGRNKGALPWLVFDPKHFVRDVGGRPVFRPTRDTTLLHLAHPLYHQALASFARLRFPGDDAGLSATRWHTRRGVVPAGAQALILLTVEELAVNELRETFHHWVRTIRIPIRKERLEAPLPHEPAGHSATPHSAATTSQDVDAARDLWQEVDDDVKSLVETTERELTRRLEATLQQAHEEMRSIESERFTSRQREIAALMGQQSIARLEREIEEFDLEQKQGLLFDLDNRVARLRRLREEREAELRRRTTHLEELREQLTRERARVIDQLLPKRFALRGSARVFPVTVEIRLPEEG